MSRKSLVYMFLTLVLTAYLVAALVVADRMSAAELAGPVEVEIVNRTSNFVTPEGIIAELKKKHYDRTDGQTLPEVDLAGIENYLKAIDNLENATVYRSFKGDKSRIVVQVVPMKPIARVFDGNKSFYVNRSGKKLTAGSRYQVDVPVFVGDLSKAGGVEGIIPIVDYLESDLNFAAFVSFIEISRDGDLIIYPNHTGPVINFGDASLIKNKLTRLMRIYQDVIPVKGYAYYDTLSVKFAGQVVATRHHKTKPEPTILYETETDPENISLGYLDTVPVSRNAPLEPSPLPDGPDQIKNN